MEIEGPFRLRVKLATVAVLTLGLILFMAWALWDQNRLIASQQGGIKRLQGYSRHLEERLGILTLNHPTGVVRGDDQGLQGQPRESGAKTRRGEDSSG